MATTKLKVRGSLSEELLSFIEDEKMKSNSPYKSAILEEEQRNYGDGKLAGIGEVLLLVVTIAQDLIKDIIKDFLKDKLKGNDHSAKYKLTNDEGKELEITLNKLSLSEIEDIINRFQGNIVEIESA